MCGYLRTKLQVSSIILTSFRQEGVILQPPPRTTAKTTPKKSTLIRVKNVKSDVSLEGTDTLFYRIKNLLIS